MRVERGGAVGGHLHRVPLLHQALTDEGRDLPLVFDHEDPHLGCRIAPGSGGRKTRPPARKEPTVIDLFSDTLTRPTPEMRRFMCEAEVGDEQKGEDPTVNRLQEMVAELLGKEAAVYLPSGTMCNEIALKVHTRPGDEVLADRTSHLIHFEGGGPGLSPGCS